MKDRGGRIVALVALLIGVISLSFGFAAFSSSLTISSNANVQLDDSVWEVGFSTVNSAITSGTVNGETNSSNNGTLSVSQFVISQGTSATLSTTNGSQVVYDDIYIVNDGSLDAFLNSVTMGTLSCEYITSNRTTDDGHTTITAGTGQITPTDCNAMFGATLTIGSSTYTAGSAAQTSGFGTTNQLLVSGTKYVPVTLTIAYKTDGVDNTTTKPNGDFKVTLSDTTVVYGTSSN